MYRLGVANLLLFYPSFEGIDEMELHVLARFRAFMVAALQLIKAKNNKTQLIAIASMLSEGRLYITGSGQTAATSRRVLIYDVESAPCSS